MQQIKGRCIQINSQAGKNRVTISTQNGIVTVELASDQEVCIGDWLSIDPGSDNLGKVILRQPGSARRSQAVLKDRRLRCMQERQNILQALRSLFAEEYGFMEVRTPVLVPSPGMEAHIHPMQARDLEISSHHLGYLQTSPEMAMKKLIVAGMEKIYQVCPVFRHEPQSSTHLPEFEMLEWYRSMDRLETIAEDVEALFEKIRGERQIERNGVVIDITRPWPRWTCAELFDEHTGIDLGRASKDDFLAYCQNNKISVNPETAQKMEWNEWFHLIWLNRIESQLPRDRPCLVSQYPKSLAAMSEIVTDEQGREWANRFEVYVGGLELGNAYQELTDAQEFEKRFEQEMQIRQKAYSGAILPQKMDPDFLDALREGYPPSAGIAMGLNRLVMLFAQEDDILNTHWP